jgi:hypothetical protein
MVTRTGEAAAADQTPGEDMRVAYVDVGGYERFVTAQKNTNGKLELAAWSLSGDGATVTRLSLTESVDIVELGGKAVSAFGPYVVVPVRTDDTENNDGSVDGWLRIYEVGLDGTLTLETTRERSNALELAVAGRTESNGRHYLAGASRDTLQLDIPLWEVFGP